LVLAITISFALYTQCKLSLATRSNGSVFNFLQNSPEIIVRTVVSFQVSQMPNTSDNLPACYYVMHLNLSRSLIQFRKMHTTTRTLLINMEPLNEDTVCSLSRSLLVSRASYQHSPSYTFFMSPVHKLVIITQGGSLQKIVLFSFILHSIKFFPSDVCGDT